MTDDERHPQGATRGAKDGVKRGTRGAKHGTAAGAGAEGSRAKAAAALASAELASAEPPDDGEPMPFVHPGEVLLEVFLKPLGLSQYRLALDTSVPPRRINEIVHGKRAISADTALRLSRFFGNTALFWMRLQTHHDLRVEQRRLGDRLDREVKPYRRAS